MLSDKKRNPLIHIDKNTYIIPELTDLWLSLQLTSYDTKKKKLMINWK